MEANINSMKASSNKVKSHAYSTEEICNKIAELFVEQDEYGDIMIAGVPDSDSILDSRKFCKAVLSFVEAVKNTDPYNALSSLAYIVSWAEIDQLVNWLSNVATKKCEWLNSVKWEEVIIDDYLVNRVWKQPNFNKKAAILLYGMVSYLTDSGFNIRMYNYNGDIASISVATENASCLFEEDF